MAKLKILCRNLNNNSLKVFSSWAILIQAVGWTWPVGGNFQHLYQIINKTVKQALKLGGATLQLEITAPVYITEQHGIISFYGLSYLDTNHHSPPVCWRLKQALALESLPSPFCSLLFSSTHRACSLQECILDCYHFPPELQPSWTVLVSFDNTLWTTWWTSHITFITPHIPCPW